MSDELLVNFDTIFMIRVSDDAMKRTGIFANDLLIVDKSPQPKHGDIVVAALNDRLLVRRLITKYRKPELKAENPKFKTIQIADADELELWGVAVNVVHPLVDI